MASLTGKNALITGNGGNIKVTAKFDLTGYTLKFTVKPETGLVANTDAGAVMQLVYVCPSTAEIASGIAYIPYTTTDSNVTQGKYKFDVKFIKSGQQPFSSQREDIEFKYGVTKS